MAIRTIPLSRLETDPQKTLNECAESGETVVVEMPDQRLLAIQLLDPGADDSLMDELLAANPKFQALVAKSKASARNPFFVADYERVMKPAFWATIVTYVSMFGITAAIHWNLDEFSAFWITVLIGFSGAIFGWLAGFLAAPYDEAEGRRLTQIASLLSLLMSGYLLGKLEHSISEVFTNLLNHPLYGVRLLNFSINFVATAITVYLYRLYGGGRPNSMGIAQSANPPVVKR
jgi:hypothetical protein